MTTAQFAGWLDDQLGDAFRVTGVGGPARLVTTTGPWDTSDGDRSVVEVNLGGASLANGDGLLLDGQTLYAVRNADRAIVKVAMAADFASGQVQSSTTDASFLFPTTIARADDRLLVVNSQLNRRNAGQPPELPFTLTSVALP